MNTTNQANNRKMKDLEVVKSLEQDLPGIEKLYQKLAVHEKSLEQWFAQRDDAYTLFKNNPHECLKEILADNYKDIQEDITAMEQKLRPPLSEKRVHASESASTYVPATISYTNGWDVISGNSIPIINKAFEVAYKKFCTDSMGDAKTFEFVKEFCSEDTEETTCVKVSMGIPTLSITGVCGTKMGFTTGKTTVHISIKDKGELAEREFTIENCWIEAKINIANTVVTTEKGDSVFKVFIGVVSDESQDNNMVYPEVDFHGDTPKGIPNVIWKTVLITIGEGLQNMIANMEAGKEYNICSVTLNEQAQEKMEKFNWLIPNTARFNTQQDSEGDNLENYALIVFMMTTHPIKEGLNLDVPEQTINGKNSGTAALSGPILMKEVMLPAVNSALEERFKVKDAFIYVEGSSTSQGHLKTGSGKAINMSVSSKSIKLDNIFLRLMDGGVHLESDIHVSIAKIVKASGKFRVKLEIEVTPNGEEVSCKIDSTVPDVEVSAGLDVVGWVLAVILAGFSLLIGGLIDIIAISVIYTLDDVLNIEEISKQLNLFIDKVVNWNRIDLHNISFVDISYGAKFGYEMDVTE